MVKYQLLKNNELAYVRSYETTNPSKSYAVFTCTFSDLPLVKEILQGQGKINTYKYTLKFDKGWLTIKYTWNKALYKKVRIGNLSNLIDVISDAMGKKESLFRRWFRKWGLFKGGYHDVKNV